MTLNLLLLTHRLLFNTFFSESCASFCALNTLINMFSTSFLIKSQHDKIPEDSLHLSLQLHWGIDWSKIHYWPSSSSSSSLSSPSLSSSSRDWWASLCATAVTMAAPFPLPSSETRKVMSHWGASRRTAFWSLLLKLEKEGKREGGVERTELPDFTV